MAFNHNIDKNRVIGYDSIETEEQHFVRKAEGVIALDDNSEERKR